MSALLVGGRVGGHLLRMGQCSHSGQCSQADQPPHRCVGEALFDLQVGERGGVDDGHGARPLSGGAGGRQQQGAWLCRRPFPRPVPACEMPRRLARTVLPEQGRRVSHLRLLRGRRLLRRPRVLPSTRGHAAGIYSARPARDEARSALLLALACRQPAAEQLHVCVRPLLRWRLLQRRARLGGDVQQHSPALQGPMDHRSTVPRLAPRRGVACGDGRLLGGRHSSPGASGLSA
mmetsp:Transcript_133/g.416  ORF Transcript_133/g.416 Transcript_133/m.416 type:complete len:233 (+) Transcript_133:190-888(+)